VEAQEAPSDHGKVLNSEISWRALVALIAKFSPAVCGFLHFLQRHVTEPAKLEKVGDLEKVTGYGADGLPAGSARFKMG
jgi:hypothetical protein